MVDAQGIPMIAFAVGGGAVLVFMLLVGTLASAGLLGGRSAQRRAASVVSRHRPMADDDQQKLSVAKRPRRKSDGGGLDSLARRYLPNPEMLRIRLARTGMNLTVGKYFLSCLILALVSGIGIWTQVRIPMLAGSVGFVIGLGFPHMFVKYLIGRRRNKFISQFPEAIDLIVRGLKSGLPVTDSFNAIATETQDPIRAEFKMVADMLSLGKTLDEALWAAANRVGAPEFNFFVVALSVQRETGGNLAETLENLGEILRKRRQTKLKIKALSSEARASALIIGVLPFVMFFLIYLINPEYLSALWLDNRGMVMTGVGLVWLLTGFGVMAKMVRFEI